MTLEEFVSELKKLNFDILIQSDFIKIFDEKDRCLVSIDLDKRFKNEFLGRFFQLNEAKQEELFELVYQFSKTPLKNRNNDFKTKIENLDCGNQMLGNYLKK